ncbi:MAG: hypothetical protein JST12_04855 [Armatimonadetes bacterium]|nr:hypothetical protein [Armatimonadota bacterium]MBS1728573.1 hypothetical protein [Armatimonadota bacterium]
MNHHDESIPLAKSPHGTVRICPVGCTHVDFNKITLDYDSPSQFQEALKSILSAENKTRFQHDGITIELSDDLASELRHLMQEAASTLTWIDGQMQFTDEDFQQILRRLGG